jgi:hypothetical protein
MLQRRECSDGPIATLRIAVNSILFDHQSAGFDDLLRNPSRCRAGCHVNVRQLSPSQPDNRQKVKTIDVDLTFVLDAHNMCRYRPVNPLKAMQAALCFEFTSNFWPDRIADHDLAGPCGGNKPRP